MKKKPEPKRTESLPAFLASHAEDSSAAEPAVDTMLASDDAAVATADADAESVFAAGETEETATDASSADADAADAAELEVPEPASASPGARTRDAAESRAPADTGSLAMLTMLGGVAASLGAAATAFVPSLAAYAGAANVLFVLGAVLLATGATQRSAARVQRRLDDAERRRREETGAMQQHLQTLVDDRGEKAPAEGEELQHVLMALQRQDEKINNLTRAIKMYGKPLMEISGQATELASAVAGVKLVVEANADETRESTSKLEAQLRDAAEGKEIEALGTSLGAALEKLAARVEGGAGEAKQAASKLEAQLRSAGSTKELAELVGAVEQLATRIEGLGKKGPAISLEPLEKHIGKLEIGIAAVAQRLEDSEVRKSLLRLEETTQKGRDAVQLLLKGDAVREATTQLQSRVDAATKGIADGISKLRDGNIGGLEATVREIQREISGVATTVSQINAAMKSGARVAAAPAQAPAASAPATSAAPTASAPAPASAPGAAPAAAAGGEGYATGARTSGAKNVLGAIAKLKQMKG